MKKNQSIILKMMFVVSCWLFMMTVYAKIEITEDSIVISGERYEAASDKDKIEKIYNVFLNIPHLRLVHLVTIDDVALFAAAMHRLINTVYMKNRQDILEHDSNTSMIGKRSRIIDKLRIDIDYDIYDPCVRQIKYTYGPNTNEQCHFAILFAIFSINTLDFTHVDMDGIYYLYMIMSWCDALGNSETLPGLGSLEVREILFDYNYIDKSWPVCFLNCRFFQRQGISFNRYIDPLRGMLGRDGSVFRNAVVRDTSGSNFGAILPASTPVPPTGDSGTTTTTTITSTTSSSAVPESPATASSAAASVPTSISVLVPKNLKDISTEQLNTMMNNHAISQEDRDRISAELTMRLEDNMMTDGSQMMNRTVVEARPIAQPLPAVVLQQQNLLARGSSSNII